MITPLRPNMSPDVQLFFMDPLEVAAKLHKQLLKVLDFQKTQRKRLTGPHFCTKMNYPIIIIHDKGSVGYTERYNIA